MKLRASGKHRKKKNFTTNSKFTERSGQRTFSKVLFTVAMLLGIATISVAMHGMKVHVTIEP